jgi:hypothetical protein
VRKFTLFLLFALILSPFAVRAWAHPIVPQDAPALSWKRVTSSLQFNWQYDTPEGDEVSPIPAGGEGEPRATLGYSFGSLTVGASEGYGLVSGIPRTALGGRITPFKRKDTTEPIVSVGADYMIYGEGRDAAPARKSEGVASLNAALPFWAYVMPVGSVGVGLASHLLSARVGLSLLWLDGSR